MQDNCNMYPELLNNLSKLMVTSFLMIYSHKKLELVKEFI
jgi:hypothetical protein